MRGEIPDAMSIASDVAPKEIPFGSRKLLPPEFRRVHRSHIVNLRHVDHILTLEGGARVILLKNGTRVPVSRAGAKALSSDLI